MNRTISLKTLAWFLTVLLATPPTILAQQAEQTVFKQEELDQILAPIALHPDPLVSQILMASTYPLEVVQADRWAKQNAKLKGDALTAALEKQDWDASVKSLVNFPQVLTMMSEKLDWTQKLGDAFLADQKVVLDTIQKLRAKAQESGNLKTTQEQTVIVEEKIIKIEPANPQVIYVPSYNPTVVYGAWPYPAYPPYYYYPPGYVATSMFAFGAGVAMGAAWGYAWGNSNWGGGNVDVDVNRNFNSNRNIDRSKYQGGDRGQGGRFQHNPEHRKGVSYRDQGTSQKFNRASTNDAIKSREQFRGRAEQGRDGGDGDEQQSLVSRKPAHRGPVNWRSASSRHRGNLSATPAACRYSLSSCSGLNGPLSISASRLSTRSLRTSVNASRHGYGAAPVSLAFPRPAACRRRPRALDLSRQRCRRPAGSDP